MTQNVAFAISFFRSSESFDNKAALILSLKNGDDQDSKNCFEMDPSEKIHQTEH